MALLLTKWYVVVTSDEHTVARTSVLVLSCHRDRQAKVKVEKQWRYLWAAVDTENMKLLRIVPRHQERASMHPNSYDAYSGLHEHSYNARQWRTVVSMGVNSMWSTVETGDIRKAERGDTVVQHLQRQVKRFYRRCRITYT